MNEYEVRVTRQALEQMKEIVHYISNDLMTPDAADNLLDKMKAEMAYMKALQNLEQMENMVEEDRKSTRLNSSHQ